MMFIFGGAGELGKVLGDLCIFDMDRRVFCEVRNSNQDLFLGKVEDYSSSA